MSLLVRLNAVLIVAFAVVGIIVDRLCASQIQANARRQVLGTAALLTAVFLPLTTRLYRKG